MPLYEYKCEQCNYLIEVLQSHDDVAPVCTVCAQAMQGEAPLMIKQISRSSFVLKGTGWAADGYGA